MIPLLSSSQGKGLPFPSRSTPQSSVFSPVRKETSIKSWICFFTHCCMTFPEIAQLHGGMGVLSEIFNQEKTLKVKFFFLNNANFCHVEIKPTSTRK